jgi:hypothetical protein
MPIAQLIFFLQLPMCDTCTKTIHVLYLNYMLIPLRVDYLPYFHHMSRVNFVHLSLILHRLIVFKSLFIITWLTFKKKIICLIVHSWFIKPDISAQHGSTSPVKTFKLLVNVFPLPWKEYSWIYDKFIIHGVWSPKDYEMLGC